MKLKMHLYYLGHQLFLSFLDLTNMEKEIEFIMCPGTCQEQFKLSSTIDKLSEFPLNRSVFNTIYCQSSSNSLFF